MKYPGNHRLTAFGGLSCRLENIASAARVFRSHTVFKSLTVRSRTAMWLIEFPVKRYLDNRVSTLQTVRRTTTHVYSEKVVLQLTSLCLMSSEGLLLADCRGEEVSLLSFLLSPLLLLLEEGGAVALGGGDGTVGGSSPVR